jgi:hypothetical protein
MSKIIRLTSTRNSKGDINIMYVNTDHILFFFRNTMVKNYGIDTGYREVTTVALGDRELQVNETVEYLKLNMGVA